ncbi:MAG: hypothetical protein H6608_04365 [Flavobacteriales bacterium]|nr:hypothetical protein [Bacteroidota bacterium]MCB9240336.1 hypothetical protein [Flavobacteriales bacterium]
MNSNLHVKLSWLLFLPIVLAACASGKKKFEQGDYDKATYQAINRLRSNPDSKKARKYLPMAYEHALKFHLDKIDQLKKSTAEFRYDGIVGHYASLNDMYNQIIQCPACIRIIDEPRVFQNEFNDASLLASKAHFNAGLKELEKGDAASGRAAYRHFLDAKQYTPQYDKIEDYLSQALDQGTIRVLIDDIPVHSRSLALTNEFFQNQIVEFARNMNYTFVQFYRTGELDVLGIEPDEVIVMRFDDFAVGQVYMKERVESFEKDSVILRTEKTDDGEVPIYGTAKAKLTTYEKTLTSSGLLDFQIVNAVSGATMQQRKLPGTFVWSTKWASFNGMEEALSRDQLNLTKQRELYPPAPQDLFVEFTRPIFNQITGIIRNHYKPLKD